GAEVGDQVLLRIEQVAKGGLGRRLAVVVVSRQDPVVVLHVDAVFGRILEPLLGDAPQEYLGVVAAAFPQPRVEAVEQVAYRAVPAVEQIVGELGEPGEGRGQGRLYFQDVARTVHVTSGASMD